MFSQLSLMPLTNASLCTLCLTWRELRSAMFKPDAAYFNCSDDRLIQLGEPVA